MALNVISNFAANVAHRNLARSDMELFLFQFLAIASANSIMNSLTATTEAMANSNR